MIITKETELTSLRKKKKLKRKDGPFVQALDNALASFHVYRQAYYSGTFVGNHVHRTLQVGKHFKDPEILIATKLGSEYQNPVRISGRHSEHTMPSTQPQSRVCQEDI